jgi:Secretion system C-terminal sorting domain
MKTRLLFYLMLLVGLNANAQIINVSTGIDNSGNSLSQYSTDPNWVITSPGTSSSVTALVSDFVSFAWEQSPVAITNANWINQDGTQFIDQAYNGINIYERNFIVPNGVTNFSLNFAIAYDDAFVSLEIVKPDLSTIPLTLTSTTSYHLSNIITNNIATSGQFGTWKIKANINHIGGQAGFLLSGTINIIPSSTVVCLPASKDTMIHEFVPTRNFGSNTILQPSRWTYDANGGSGFYTTKTLQQFNLSSIPAGAVITSAVMKLHVDTVTSPYNQHRDLGGGTGNSAIINQVGSAWAENTVTWNTAPTILASSVAVPSLGEGSTADVVANVTAMVQNMITTGVNNGFQISLTDNSDYYHSLVFGSREDLNSGGIFKPELCVTYTVPAPTPKVIPSQCGITLTSLWNTIFCTTVASATNYRFEVSNGAFIQTFDTALGANRCNMYDFTGITLGTTYAVRVAAKVGGLWQGFGASCNITTPAGIPTSNVIPSQCGMTITNFWNTIFVQNITGVPGVVSGYKIELTDAVHGVRTYPSSTNHFNLHNFDSQGGGAANTVYTVRVAVLYNGIYQPYGSPCTITTSLGAVRESDGSSSDMFTVNAFPNPFADNFKLDINSNSDTSLAIKVYDMMGRIIESRQFKATDLNSLEIGANYSSGVYNIIVTQGENVKTLRVIKK